MGGYGINNSVKHSEETIRKDGARNKILTTGENKTDKNQHWERDNADVVKDKHLQ